jgi:hypothetical protein
VEKILAYSNPQELRARLSGLELQGGNRSEATIYEQCGFPTLHRTLARVGSRMRPIQALYSAGGDADSVRELSVTATGRCSANDRSAAAATRAVIRPSSR